MSLDASIVIALNAAVGQSTILDRALLFGAVYLPYLVILLFLALVIGAAYPRREKLEMVLVVLSASLIARFGAVEVIRHYVHRARPLVDLPLHALFTESSWSFPSGHATFFFGMAMAIYCHHRRWGVLFFALAALISFARVTAGVHYPTDILGGAILGVTISWLIYSVIEVYRHRVKN